jgi:hypothetical protein
MNSTNTARQRRISVQFMNISNKYTCVQQIYGDIMLSNGGNDNVSHLQQPKHRSGACFWVHEQIG